MGIYRTIKVHKGPLKTKWNHGGSYKTIMGDMVCLKTLGFEEFQCEQSVPRLRVVNEFVEN